jgi:DNA invertase Pin-like site-specific DNA recombinase
LERAIAYLRVSIQRQQRSGLGIEAQRAVIQRFAAAVSVTIVAAFVEFESARVPTRWTGRPQLAAALAAAKTAKCSVIVAKLDQLLRDVAFVARFMAQRVPWSRTEPGCRSLHAAPLCRLGRKGAAVDR